MTIKDRVRDFAKRVVAELEPSDAAWRGAAIAVIGFVVILVAVFFVTYFIQDFTWQKLPAFFVRLGALFLLGILAVVGVALLMRIPVLYRIALLVFTPFVLFVVAPGNDKQGAIFTGIVILVVSFIGAGIAVFRREGLYPLGQKATVGVLVIGLAGACGGLYAIFSEKSPPNPLLEGYVVEDRTLDLPNPGEPGEFAVMETSYGSGTDRHREEFGAAAGFHSRSVDGAKLIDNWDGLSGWLRTSFWGFDVSALPLQARVWYPEGDGPFPLVLVVHGNHSMEDFSDPGYGYLGELFASRGIVLASVDANFLNSSISASVDLFADRPGLKEENDARGWLLLQHLAQWRDWNTEVGHPFDGKVDMDRVALIGHSRGGEAVAVAAAFNQLERYPDDATLEFDFGFNLRGVIAIAPVDGQYKPRDNPTPIRDVNYFTIHGSMDGDVQTFDGAAQYSRVSLSGDQFGFRSSLYVDGANHGQFNTTWGNMDNSLFRAWPLDFARIMDGEAQRDVARVYFSAFMEVVLRDRHEYLPIFADVRKAAAWLPDVFYISQFSSTDDRVLTDFEEDIDPATMSVPGGRIATRHVSKWYEVRNSLKSNYRVSQHDTHAAVFAWDSKFSPETASVSFILPGSNIAIDADSIINLSLSQAGESSMPEDHDADAGEATDSEDDAKDEPLDWTVRLVDSFGTLADLPLSRDAPLYPQVNAVPRRASFLESEDTSDALFQRFRLPVADFLAAEPALDVSDLVRIEFVFDRNKSGAIKVDDISITLAR